MEDDMALVLDTDTLDPCDRADALAAAILRVSAPAYLEYAPSSGPVTGRMYAWGLGHLDVLRLELSGLRVVRTARQIRVSPSPTLATIVVDPRGTPALHWIHAEVRDLTGPGELSTFDLNLPYDLNWRGGGVTVLFVPLERLGLPTETIRAGLGCLRASPLYRLMVEHIGLLARSIPELEGDPGAQGLGDASTEMLRALIVSAATRDSADGTMVPADLLLTQIREYVRRRLASPDLCPASIAHAHHISVRYLYKLCARAGIGLEQWIIAQRLERARTELARAEYRYRSIAAVAYGCGFRDPSHFARRFRAAYGMSPGQWRREAHAGHGFPTAPPAGTLRAASDSPGASEPSGNAGI
ncbi:AraC family transcriptional regulator [Nocardia terpenica]|uniref:AraC family transcriptional regulator n=2 Tax=Nocardia terpenica TaxID=455432 RepID=A0A291RUN1_9NOCA|nr:AraC family transcriptional regulator [Nocardia terpenica]